MADSDATRQMRRRKHKLNDHSMCLRNCRDSSASARLAAVPAGLGEDLDPAVALRQLAARALAAYLADPANAGLCREARASLLALSPSPDSAVVDELAALGREFREYR